MTSPFPVVLPLSVFQTLRKSYDSLKLPLSWLAEQNPCLCKAEYVKWCESVTVSQTISAFCLLGVEAGGRALQALEMLV